jgi:hypothetical protein
MNEKPSSAHVEAPTLPLPPPRVRPSRGVFDADEIAQLTERMTTDPQTAHVSEESESGAVARAEVPPHIKPPTREDIARNNVGLRALPAGLNDFEAFLPELCKQKPEGALQILGKRYSGDPSAANAALLQRAVNRITTSGTVDARLKGQIDKAVKLLHEKSVKQPSQGDDVSAWFYVDANYGGASMFSSLGQGWVYWAERYVGDSMNDKISSLFFSASSDEVGGNVILFENAGFVGRYLNFGLTVPPDLGAGSFAEEDVSYVGDAFNDITSSYLLVRRFDNETRPTPIGALVPQQKITDIVNSQNQISSAGSTTFTWDLWPTGPASGSDWHPNDPSKMFLYILVPINVDTQTIFGTYSAQVRYWVYLYVDDSGKLEGYVDYYGCWVQGGWITGQVQNGLMQKIPGTIGQVNDLVSQALGLANIGGPYRFLYYLPGKNAASGSTWDDLTVVGVKQ